MASWLGWTIGLSLFLVAVCISAGLHEAGHMTMARLFKISVPKFFVGFGPTLWSKKIKDTEYGIKWIPLGGFVAIEDETQPEDSVHRQMLSHVAPWKRALILLGGPVTNIILGIAILLGVMMLQPILQPSNVIDTVNSCDAEATNCAAEKSGFLPGDQIIDVNGQKISSFEDLDGKLNKEDSIVTVIRDGKELPITVSPSKEQTIGVTMGWKEEAKSFSESISTMGSVMQVNVKAIGELPGKIPDIFRSVANREGRDAESVSSVVTIGKVYGETVATPEPPSNSGFSGPSKAMTLMAYTGMLNLGLGFANLLPFMPLDGGRLLITFFDSIRLNWSKLRKKEYSPLPYKWVSALTAVTAFMLLSTMGLLVVADIIAPISVS